MVFASVLNDVLGHVNFKKIANFKSLYVLKLLTDTVIIMQTHVKFTGKNLGKWL